jgi:hypothetical protein
MNWIAQKPSGTAAVDLDVLQESALAIAQATIQNAMDESGLKPSTLAEKMGRKRPFVSRMLRGNYNMTIKTFALALGACGYRVKLGYGPLVWRWMSDTPVTAPVTSVPASAGTSMHALPSLA